jgi:hypothetical protein
MKVRAVKLSVNPSGIDTRIRRLQVFGTRHSAEPKEDNAAQATDAIVESATLLCANEAGSHVLVQFPAAQSFAMWVPLDAVTARYFVE